MKIKFNNNQLIMNGVYYNLGLSLLQEGYKKITEANKTVFQINDNNRFSVADIIGFVNNNVEVTDYPTFIYADTIILNEQVYPELPANVDLSGNTITFANWNNGGTQPIYTSINSLKVILRTNISGSDLDGETIKKLSLRNVEVLGIKSLMDKVNSTEFNSEAVEEAKTVKWVSDNWLTEFTDFKQARTCMKQCVVGQQGFENLSLEEKVIAARWHIVNREQMDSVLTFNERLNASEFFNKMSIKSRENRLGACMLLGRNILQYNDANEILNDILQYDFINSYVTIGREGSQEYNPEGYPDPDAVMDYLLARTGTIYETNGLLTKTHIIPTNGMTLEMFVNMLVDILMNGNY